MKLTRFTAEGKPEYGVINEGIIQVAEYVPCSGSCGVKLTDRKYERRNVKLLAPCEPSKVVAVGLNYYSHARELKKDIPATPLLFIKPSTSVIGPEDFIIYPPASRRVDYEGELGVVIGATAHRVSMERAFDYVLGYTCFNDITARDLQELDGQWTRAKGFDTFAAIGPCIETDLDPGNASIETFLNCELKQSGNTVDLIFNVAELVSFISNIMTLLPGDVIATGTPSGIGPMKTGDKVEVKITGIGSLTNYVR